MLQAKTLINELPRDFVRLSQVIHSDTKRLPYELATIFEKCLNEKSYRDTAIDNLVVLAKENHDIKLQIEKFAEDPSSRYQELSEEILSQQAKISVFKSKL